MNYYQCLDRLSTSSFAMMWWKAPNGYGLSFQEVVGDINERYVIEFEFPSDEIAYILIKDYNLPVLQYFFNKEEVIEYLINLQDWRRGADTEQPDPTTLGYVIDEAIKTFKGNNG